MNRPAAASYYAFDASMEGRLLVLLSLEMCPDVLWAIYLHRPMMLVYSIQRGADLVSKATRKGARTGAVDHGQVRAYARRKRFKKATSLPKGKCYHE